MTTKATGNGSVSPAEQASATAKSDQLGMFYKNIDTWNAVVKAVKDKHPK
tara:strand:- start:9 stop:158 length:150 start_codon:yes stop_codon:yes gene_type:complete